MFRQADMLPEISEMIKIYQDWCAKGGKKFVCVVLQVEGGERGSAVVKTVNKWQT